MTDIYINEIYPNPIDGYEWIEIYNNSNESITTTRLKLYDQTSKNLKINKDVIQPQSYAIATAAAVLNNSGDTVLLEKDGAVLETVMFGPIEQGKSYARCSNVWIENALATFAYVNLCTDEDISATVPPSQSTITPTPKSILIQQYPSPTHPIFIVPTRILPPVDFSAKHGLIKQIITPKLLPTRIILATPSDTPTSSANVMPLFFIAAVSFIQCVFLVYLIIKRIKFDAPFSLKHENN